MGDKSTIPYFTIILIIALIGGGIIYFFFFEEESSPQESIPPVKSAEEILEDLTASVSGEPEITQEIIETLTAPGQGIGPEQIQEIIDSLTAPE